MADAVVIGAGPNGLVAANLLVDAGWEVVVLEEAPEPGGAVRSAELIEPGFVNDLFSAFYPFAAASPHIQGLDLERWGLRWLRGGVPVAHPASDGTCPAVGGDVHETASWLNELAPGDGHAWEALYRRWEEVDDGALGAFFGLFPPIRPVIGLARTLGFAELLRFARFAVLPVRRMGEEHFRHDGGTRLLAGNALHADVAPDSPLSGMFGWVLCCLAQQVGFPVPEGGAGNLTAALVRRLEAGGGRLRYGVRAESVQCSAGRAVAVLAGGERYPAARAVIADVDAPQLYSELLSGEPQAERTRRELVGFQFDNATVKVDWTLDGPIPWLIPRVREAGTVHVAEGMAALTRHQFEIFSRLLPSEPYLVLGQYSHLDPTRAPAGKETAWAYTHVPREIVGDSRGELTGRWEDEAESARFADRIEEQVERLAPGFRALIRGRHVFTPPSLQAANRNLVRGALNGGTAQLHQQLVFRPVPSLGRPETPIERLFLGSASAHPGGGVHGGPGANAARAALAAARRFGVQPIGRLSRALQR
jgi:phytoene dehydrogenase-like protein